MIHICVATLLLLACSARCVRVDSQVLEEALELVIHEGEHGEGELVQRDEKPVDREAALETVSQASQCADLFMKNENLSKDTYSEDEYHLYYLNHFLTRDLITEEGVQTLKFRGSSEEFARMRTFLLKYREWADTQERKLVHNFEVGADTDVVIVGDLHGHFASLRAAVEFWRRKENAYLVFLGDFVDRGRREVETAIAILALQRCMNDRVIVLRGNHEHGQWISDDQILEDGDDAEFLPDEDFTLHQRLVGLFSYSDGSTIWLSFVKTFWKLPAAAIMKRGSQKYMMVHGGWNGHMLNKIRNATEVFVSGSNRSVTNRLSLPSGIERGTLNQKLRAWLRYLEKDFAHDTIEGVAHALVWSDITFRKSTWYSTSRRDNFAGTILSYGPQAILQMLETLGIDWCISGHAHANVVLPFESHGYTKGHAVVLSANQFSPYHSAGRIVVIKTHHGKDPMPGFGVKPWTMQFMCCCTLTPLASCKHKNAAEKCCKFKKGTSCEKSRLGKAAVAIGASKHKYKLLSPISDCGSPPHFYELDRPSQDEGDFISKYTFKGPLTEGHSA